MAVTVTRELRDYADLLDMPAPKSRFHVPMDRLTRAAQFSSYKSLSGFEDSIGETGRITEDEPEALQQEEGMWYINDRLNILSEHLAERPQVTVLYFRRDPKKPGGSTEELTGRVCRIDSYTSRLILLAENGVSEGPWVPLADICRLDSPLFS